MAFAPVILRGDALQYYVEHVRDHGTTYRHFKKLIQARCNNRAMQERVKADLQCLRFDLFTKSGTSPNDELIKLVSVIKQNYSETPLSWQCEGKKL